MFRSDHETPSLGKRKRDASELPHERDQAAVGPQVHSWTALTTLPAGQTEAPPSDRPSQHDGDDIFRPTHRPLEAPFYPGAIEMWVVDLSDGSARLVSDRVPGARHWRIGDPNVDFCVLCNEPGDLIGCRTCKRSYHRLCLDPPLLQSVDQEDFHCSTCKGRGWHTRPPPNILPLDRGGLGESQGRSKISSQSQNIAASSSGLASHGDSSHHTQVQAFIQGREVPTPNLQPILVDQTDASEDIKAKAPRPGKRRSRYQTVSDEVDGAMTTIYRELESANELRSEITRLREKVVKLEQESQIQQGKVALVREDILAQNNAEVSWLREEVARLGKAHDSLSAANEQLRTQVKEANLVSDERLKEMNEMKANLREWLNK